VIQQYVSLGMGVGLVASMAVDQGKHQDMVAIHAAHLFKANIARLAVRRGAYLRGYALDFIQQFAPELKRADIVAALNEASV